VQFQIVGYQGVLEWTTRDGSIRRLEFFPSTRLTLTNLQTGEVIRLAAGGPGHITQGTDGSFDFSGTGPWVFPRRPGTNEPGIWETVGNPSFTSTQRGTSPSTWPGGWSTSVPNSPPDRCRWLAGTFTARRRLRRPYCHAALRAGRAKPRSLTTAYGAVVRSVARTGTIR